MPSQCAYFHVTHWKAGSQWVRGILEELFGPAVERPQYFLAHVLAQPVQPGRIYPCVYSGKPEFETVPCSGEKRYFVLIRDLRDTLVSGYYSLRNTHETKVPELAFFRQILLRLNREEGLLYLMDTWLHQSARIQRTWLEAKANFFRLEDCMADAPGMLRKMLTEGWDVQLRPELLADVALRHSFAKLSGGRAPGQEDLKSHYRRGVAGDWKSHFTPAVTDRFKVLFNDLLLHAGYETEEDWPVSGSHTAAINFAIPGNAENSQA